MKAIPLWLAVAITVVVSLPFGLWLNEWSLPLWAAFIVWAEYFALGATPAALKTMVPAYLLGVVGTTLVLILMIAVQKAIPDISLVSATDVAIAIAFFIGFCLLIYAMKIFPVTQTGSLPFFNGISMTLATYFIAGLGATAYVAYGGINLGSDYLVPVVSAIPAALAGLLGAFLGWFNIVIMKPFRSE